MELDFSKSTRILALALSTNRTLIAYYAFLTYFHHYEINEEDKSPNPKSNRTLLTFYTAFNPFSLLLSLQIANQSRPYLKKKHLLNNLILNTPRRPSELSS